MYYFIASEDIDHPEQAGTYCVELGQIIALVDFPALCAEHGVDHVAGFIAQGLHLAETISNNIIATA